MSKVYVVYMVSKGIDDTTNILGVYDSKERAEGHLYRAYHNIINALPTLPNSWYSEGKGKAIIYFEYNSESAFYIKEMELNYDRTLN